MELSGTPVAPLNSAASHLMMSMSACGLLLGSCVSVGALPAARGHEKTRQSGFESSISYRKECKSRHNQDKGHGPFPKKQARDLG
ncbi:MAG: hypothetical protein SPG36_02455 [Eggerthellaceae bacterium]|nr:hypothetical protein [Eggerthellaceae bacterium]